MKSVTFITFCSLAAVFSKHLNLQRTRIESDFTSFLPPCRYEVELEGLKDEYAKTLEDAKKEKVLPSSALISVFWLKSVLGGD